MEMITKFGRMSIRPDGWKRFHAQKSLKIRLQKDNILMGGGISDLMGKDKIAPPKWLKKGGKSQDLDGISSLVGGWVTNVPFST